MKHTRLIILIVLAIAVALATIHFTINGFPSLDRLNPHAKPGGSAAQLPVDLARKVLSSLSTRRL